MRHLARPHETLRHRYDAVVVGSGYGGGVAACRLARAGKRVAVLERGREFLTGEFPSRFTDIRNELQVTGRRVRMGSPRGLYDVRLGEDMHVLVGCGLGGGSLINAGVALRPDPRVFADPIWPGQMAQDGLLAEGYRRAERWLRPARHPRAHEMSKYQVLEAAGRSLGRETVAPPVVVSFEANTNPAGVAQPPCTLCGDCCGGCNVGAKNTVALTYLPDAVRHGAEIFTCVKVRRLGKTREGAWEVHVVLNEGAGSAEQERTILAPVVVLAAGTLGSTEILLRSREEGLKLSHRLGERFSANGDIIAFAYGSKSVVNAIGIGHPPKIEGHEVGACVSGQIEFRNADNLAEELCVQEGVLPSALAPALPVLFIPNGRLLGALQSLINGVYKGPFARLQTFFAVSHDDSAGRLRLEDDRIGVVWPGAKDEPVYARLDATLAGLAAEAGGTYVKNPLSGTIMGEQPATAHPLGGCAIGVDRDQGVVDHAGRVFDAAAGRDSAAVHEGLFVMDGSIIPRSLGVNPLLTITAIAERAMIHLLEQYGLPCEDRSVEGPSVAPAEVGALSLV